MTQVIGQREYQTKIRNWIDQDFTLTHAATLTLRPAFQRPDAARAVCQKFQHKLNKAIWGRNAWDNRLAEIAFVPITQSTDAHCGGLHLHLALGGFPAHMSESQLLGKFESAAQATPGVWHEVDFAPIEGNWLNYITRELRQRTDATLLADLMAKAKHRFAARA